MPHRLPRLLLIVALGLGAGCAANAHYEVVAPAASRGPIGRNAGAIVTRDRIDYEIFQADEKIVVRFVNRTGLPIRLTESSASLDASGRSFNVEPQEVPPDQAGRVILPPNFAVDRERLASVATPVRIGGIDEGGLIGSRRDVETNTSTNAPGGAGAPPPGFRWPAGRQIRLRLVYDVTPPTPTTSTTNLPTTTPASTTLTHEFSLRRSE